MTHRATAEPALAQDVGNSVKASLPQFFQVKNEVKYSILTVKSKRMREWWLTLNTVTYL